MPNQCFGNQDVFPATSSDTDSPFYFPFWACPDIFTFRFHLLLDSVLSHLLRNYFLMSTCMKINKGQA